MGTSKSVTVQIAQGDLENLKNNNYKLCFAKKVNDTFDVVWQSYNEYLANNTFSWTPVYEIFGTNTFQDDITVIVDTNTVSITLGEQATMDAAGNIGNASTGGPTDSITFNNNYGNIHPGINQVSTGPDGKQVSTPIYVAPDVDVPGQDVLTPIEMVMVWFEQNIQTSTMFSDAKSNPAYADLTQVDSVTLLYSNNVWSTPSNQQAQLTEPVTILQIIVYVTGAIIAQDLASKIASKLTGVYKNINVNVSNGANNQVTINYQEQRGLSLSDSKILGILRDTPTTVDALTDFAMDSLAASNVGYTSLSATTKAKF